MVWLHNSLAITPRKVPIHKADILDESFSQLLFIVRHHLIHFGDHLAWFPITFSSKISSYNYFQVN